MKTKTCQKNRNRASALVITISVIAIAVLVLASYLMTVQTQVSSVSRSQTWNSAISLAEAGMEEGMAMVNLGSPSIIIDPWAWTNTLSGAGWSTFGTNSTVTRYVSGSNYYVTTISLNGTNAPVITSAGVVSYNPIPWRFTDSGMHPFLAVVGVTNNQQNTSTSAIMGRKIQVSTVLSPLFSAAVVAKTNFDMNGNNCTVDSFDSSTSIYSTLGQWDGTKRKAHGDVATDGSVVGDISLGNGNIYGAVYTGPGTVQSAVQVGPNGAVGDAAWNASHSGIEAGYWSGNFNMNVPDVSTPNTSGWSTSLPAASNGVITLNGNYVVTTAPSSPLYMSGSSVLWIKGSYAPSAGDITFATNNNARLVLYLGNPTGSGDSFTLGGNDTINQPGLAAQLQIYGLPSLTSISFAGNAGFVGTIYAPEANFSGGGGGNNNKDCSGAMVVANVTLNGHWNFHYDEYLRVAGPSRGWIATGWKEVPLN